MKLLSYKNNIKSSNESLLKLKCNGLRDEFKKSRLEITETSEYIALRWRQDFGHTLVAEIVLNNNGDLVLNTSAGSSTFDVKVYGQSARDAFVNNNLIENIGTIKGVENINKDVKKSYKNINNLLTDVESQYDILKLTLVTAKSFFSAGQKMKE